MHRHLLSWRLPPHAGQLAVAASALCLHATAPAAQPGCGSSLVVTVDATSFANNGAGVRFPPDRLRRFEQAVSRVFQTAVAQRRSPRLCARLAPLRRLRVETASGADEPVFFADPSHQAIVLQWVFAEEALRLPPPQEVTAALARWAAG